MHEKNSMVSARMLPILTGTSSYVIILIILIYPMPYLLTFIFLSFGFLIQILPLRPFNIEKIPNISERVLIILTFLLPFYGLLCGIWGLILLYVNTKIMSEILAYLLVWGYMLLISINSFINARVNKGIPSIHRIRLIIESIISFSLSFIIIVFIFTTIKVAPVLCIADIIVLSLSNIFKGIVGRFT